MSMRDEIKRERKKHLANATPKEKIAYFFEYYTLHTLAALVVVGALAVYIYTVVSTPDVVLNGIFLNTSVSKDTSDYVTELGDNFLKEQGLDTSKYAVSLDNNFTYDTTDENSSSNNYDVIQSIMVQSAAGNLDFMAGPFDAVAEFAYGGLFVDLSTILSKEELAKYEPYLYYIDNAVVEQLGSAYGDTEATATIVIPDFSKPEDMKEPIPVFIDMSHVEELTDVFGYEVETLVLGVSANAPNPDNLAAFIEFLMK